MKFALRLTNNAFKPFLAPGGYWHGGKVCEDTLLFDTKIEAEAHRDAYIAKHPKFANQVIVAVKVK